PTHFSWDAAIGGAGDGRVGGQRLSSPAAVSTACPEAYSWGRGVGQADPEGGRRGLRRSALRVVRRRSACACGAAAPARQARSLRRGSPLALGLLAAFAGWSVAAAELAGRELQAIAVLTGLVAYLALEVWRAHRRRLP